MPDMGNLTPGRRVIRIVGPDGYPQWRRSDVEVQDMWVSRELGPSAPIPYVAVQFVDGQRGIYPCHLLTEIILAEAEGERDA